MSLHSRSAERLKKELTRHLSFVKTHTRRYGDVRSSKYMSVNNSADLYDPANVSTRMSYVKQMREHSPISLVS